MKVITQAEAHALAERCPTNAERWLQNIMEHIEKCAQQGRYSVRESLTGVYTHDIHFIVEQLERCGFEVRQEKSTDDYICAYLSISW
jgi:hypothetical protein